MVPDWVKEWVLRLEGLGPVGPMTNVEKGSKYSDWQAWWPGGWDTTWGHRDSQRKEFWEDKNDIVTHMP